MNVCTDVRVLVVWSTNLKKRVIILEGTSTFLVQLRLEHL